MKITITKNDILNGVPDSFSSCPIALAIKRLHPEFQFVDVDTDAIRFGPSVFVFTRVDVSPEALDFITRFDNEIPVDPLELDIK